MSRPINPPQRKRLFTVREAAEYLGRSEAAIYELAAKGRLPVVRLDRRIQFDVRDLDLLIETKKEHTSLA